MLVGVAFGRKISRVENISLAGWASPIKDSLRRPEEDQTVLMHSGSLFEDFNSENSTLSLEFRLVGNEQALFKKSFRVLLRLNLDPTQLSGEIYKESQSEKNKNRFLVSLFEKDRSQWGLLPRKKVKKLKMKNLEFELKIEEKDGSGGKELVLRRVDLGLISEGVDAGSKPVVNISLQYFAKSHFKHTVSRFWALHNISSSIMLLAITFLLQLIASSISVLKVHLFWNSSFSKDLSKEADGEIDIFGEARFYPEISPLYFIQFFISLCLTFVYTSIYSLILIFLFLLVEILALWLFYLILANLCSEFFHPREGTLKYATYFGHYAVFVYTVGDFLIEFNGDRRELAKKYFPGIFVGSAMIAISIFYPPVVLEAHWFLLIGSVYFSIMTKYENPCLMDFLGWLIFFAEFFLFYFIYTNCYLALGYKKIFLESFFEALFRSTTIKWRSLLGSLSLLILAICVDFFLIKSAIFWKRKPRKSLATGTQIQKKLVEQHPGVLKLTVEDVNHNPGKPSKTIKLINPILGGECYCRQWRKGGEIQIFQGKTFVKRSTLKNRWGISWTYLIDRVNYKGKEKQNLISLVQIPRKEAPFQIKLFDIRNKKLIFIVNQKRDDLSSLFRKQYISKPVAIRVGRDNEIIGFWLSGGEQPNLQVTQLRYGDLDDRKVFFFHNSNTYFLIVSL